MNKRQAKAFRSLKKKFDLETQRSACAPLAE